MGDGGLAPPFLTSVLAEVEWSFSSIGRDPGTKSRCGLCEVEENLLPPCREESPDRPARSPSP
jgi:hypothetical protein